MMRACVIGNPVSHSKSPLIHRYWLEKYKIPGTYDALAVAPENLEAEVEKLVSQNYSGFNVTIPHKEKIIALCDERDESAKKIGAVNTVVIKDKKLRGLNTDAFGFIENIKTAQPGLKLEGAAALILGAGGAARAAVSGLLDADVQRILIANRTREKAEDIAADFSTNKIEVIDWNARETALGDIDLLANTTALGMKGQPELEISLGNLRGNAAVCDIVYAPLETALLRAAKEKGNKIIPGIGMLLHQARPAFQAWTGTMPEVTPELEKRVLA